MTTNDKMQAVAHLKRAVTGAGWRRLRKGDVVLATDAAWDAERGVWEPPMPAEVGLTLTSDRLGPYKRRE